MKLAQLLSVFPQLKWGESSAHMDVLKITRDSREADSGVVFVAVRGERTDGHDLLGEVCAKGVLALVVENEQRVPHDYKGAIVVVDSARRALDLLAERYYGSPAKDMFCVGVTGTNGKTTVAYMVESVLTHFGWITGVMGTIDHHVQSHVWPSQLTTPDPLTLQSRLREFKALGAQAAVFEVSSHALSQIRADSLPFNCAVFTNFTRDHLDYHGDMEAYFSAKERLFAEILGDKRTQAVAILNADDAKVASVRVREGVTVWRFGQTECELRFRILREDLDGTLFHLSTPRGSEEIRLLSPGLHNVYNSAAAVGVGLSAGVSLSTIAEALGRFSGAPGRLEKVRNNKGLHIFVDYAHTDDALASVLSTLRSTQGKTQLRGQLICVFGCGGDRDKGKRPLMLQAACRFADKVIVTSDNPRSEDPEAIIDDILSGQTAAKGANVVRESDRRQALAKALQLAHEGDVILVAGKGHEKYQIIGSQTYPFSDVDVLGELLR